MKLELKDGSSAKFWEISVDGRKVTTRWGRIGSTGQSKEEEFPNAAAARAGHDKQLAEKLKKGYQLTPGQVPVVPTGKVDPKLEQAVTERPNDERGYLVLADALSEAGDPRGELISVQHALSSGKADKKLKARETKLLSAFGLPETALVTFGWRWGFVQWAHLHNSKDWMNADFDAVALARQVFAMPMCSALEELKLGVLRWEWQEQDAPAVLKEAAKQPWAARLKHLKVGHFPDDDIDMAHHPVGDLSLISKAFPALQTLLVHSGEFNLGTLDLPRLRELTIETCAMSKKRLASVTKGNLPALEKLVLWFGSDNYGADAGLKHLGPILDGFPKVKHLGLMNAEFTDELCEALAGAKILEQLKTLDLSMGMMGDLGAAALAKKPGAFKHLEFLQVSENWITDAGIEILKTLGCPIEAKNQQEPDEADPHWRYVTVGE